MLANRLERVEMTLSKIYLSVNMTQRQNDKEKPGRSLANSFAIYESKTLVFANIFEPKFVVGLDEFTHDLD